MKLRTPLSLFAAVLALVAACDQGGSRLDKVSTNRPSAGASAHAEGDSTPAALKIDRSGSVEEQLKRLQDDRDRNAEVMAVINQQWAQQKAQQAQQERNVPAPDAMFAVDVADDIKAGQVDGPATAAVTVIKAFDFACPYCRQMSGPMEELVKEYGGKLRVVYANLLVHPVAKPAHLASCAAAKQGKYMQFKDAFWDKGFGPYSDSQGREQASLGPDNIVAIAKDVGIDTDKLKTDMASPECAKRIDHDVAEFNKFHVGGTPAFFVNGKFIDGAVPKDRFKEVIDTELRKVEASGVPAAEYFEKVVVAKGEKQFRSKMDPKTN